MKKPKPISAETLEVLKDICEIKQFDDVEEANGHMRSGAKMLAVETVKDDPDDCPFRILLGWPSDRGEPTWHA